MESEMINVKVPEDDSNTIFLVADSVLTLVERGLLRRSVLDGDTIHLVIDLPAIVFLSSLKDWNVCVEEEDVVTAAAAGNSKRGTGDFVPVASSTRIKNFLKKFFLKPLKI